jgi:hypothetical protein
LEQAPPKLDNDLIGKFDLMLAGHTHGGVLWPVKFILRKIFITDAGFLKKGCSKIFVSLPFRVILRTKSEGSLF